MHHFRMRARLLFLQVMLSQRRVHPKTDDINPSIWAVYTRNNKLPYTLNSTLDIQWQPKIPWRLISGT